MCNPCVWACPDDAGGEYWSGVAAPEDPEPELEPELCEGSGNGRRREPDPLVLRAGGLSRYGIMSVISPATFMGWMVWVALGWGPPIPLWSAKAREVYDGEEHDVEDVLGNKPSDLPIFGCFCAGIGRRDGKRNELVLELNETDEIGR
jgi:hypothetical protein